MGAGLSRVVPSVTSAAAPFLEGLVHVRRPHDGFERPVCRPPLTFFKGNVPKPFGTGC